jgi:hypothetical protein
LHGPALHGELEFHLLASCCRKIMCVCAAVRNKWGWGQWLTCTHMQCMTAFGTVYILLDRVFIPMASDAPRLSPITLANHEPMLSRTRPFAACTQHSQPRLDSTRGWGERTCCRQHYDKAERQHGSHIEDNPASAHSPTHHASHGAPRARASRHDGGTRAACSTSSRRRGSCARGCLRGGVRGSHPLCM